MTFEWDFQKSERNLQLRGFDFEFATLIFSRPYVEVADTRFDYGEDRVIALGLADDIPLTVVYTDRRGPDGSIIRRLISARVSHRKERRHYAEVVQTLAAPQQANQGSR